MVQWKHILKDGKIDHGSIYIPFDGAHLHVAMVTHDDLYLALGAFPKFCDYTRGQVFSVEGLRQLSAVISELADTLEEQLEE